MNIFRYWRLRNKRSKALVRLARIQAFNDVIKRLAGHRGGKTFMVDTTPLKVDPPFVVVTERFSLTKLSYAHCVASVCMYNRMRLEIILEDNTLKYIIRY